MYKYFMVALFAITFGLIRFAIPSHPVSASGTYEALAHLFVGGLIGAFMVSKDWWYLAVAVALSAVELAAFITLK